MRLDTSSIASTSLAVPPTQNTAPVLEFNCLYTHDIRRKSKRWQDGFLRFHTFNKRVMVYDVPRNFIGDAHWTEGDLLHDGDEVKLEKMGVLVQVADKIGQTETDLTDLRKSKNKSTANPASSSSPLRLSTAISIVNPTHHERRPLAAKHRSLNALLGPSRNPIGRTVLPSKSPFEIRKGNACDQENDHWAQQGNAKRRRISDTTEHDVLTYHDTHATTGTLAHISRAEVAIEKDKRAAGTSTKATSVPSGGRETSDKPTLREQIVQIDLCSEDDDTEILSSMHPSPRSPAQQPPKVSMPAPRKTDAKITGKRLSIAKSAPKRNQLACHSMVSDDTDSKLQQAQKRRLEARLARLQERRSTNVSLAVAAAHVQIPVVDQSKEPPKHRQETAQMEVTNDVSDDIPATCEPHSPEQSDAEQEATLPSAMIMIDEVAPSSRILDLAKDENVAFDDVATPEAESESEYSRIEMDPMITIDTEACTSLTPQHCLEMPTDINVQAVPNIVDRDETLVSSPGDIDNEAPCEEAEIPPHDGVNIDVQPAHNAPLVLNDVDQVQADAATSPTVKKVAGPPNNLAHAAQVQPFAPQRRKRVTRDDVRKSASSCFKLPTPVSRNITAATSTKAAAILRQASEETSSTITSGPWSREAFDLFVWRPPGWNEDTWSGKA